MASVLSWIMGFWIFENSGLKESKNFSQNLPFHTIADLSIRNMWETSVLRQASSAGTQMTVFYIRLLLQVVKHGDDGVYIRLLLQTVKHGGVVCVLLCRVFVI